EALPGILRGGAPQTHGRDGCFVEVSISRCFHYLGAGDFSARADSYTDLSGAFRSLSQLVDWILGDRHILPHLRALVGRKIPSSVPIPRCHKCLRLKVKPNLISVRAIFRL